MPRLFEIHTHEAGRDELTLVDLEKVCLVRVQRETGHHYTKILVRFVDGHETDSMVPPSASQKFLDAFKAYLQEQSADAV
jgi:hypothetical protein